MVYIESSQPVVQRVNTASMLSKLTLTICLLFSNTAWAEDTEYDCTQRMDYSVTSSCCRRPRLYFEAFKQSCGRYMSDGIPRMSPCLYDCIFNSSNAMSDMQLNVENAYRMMQQLLGNNKEHVDVYVKSLQNCTQNASKLLRSVRRRSFGAQACSQLPLYLGMCTMENIFVHCPSASWTRSTGCEEAREHVLHCYCDPTGKVCMQMMRTRK